MTDQHPITPPRALLNQWMTEGWHQDYCSNIEFVAARSAHYALPVPATPTEINGH